MSANISVREDSVPRESSSARKSVIKFAATLWSSLCAAGEGKESASTMQGPV